MKAFLIGLALIMISFGPALAHTRSETRTAWSVDGAAINVSLSMSDLEASRLTSDGARPDDGRLLTYLSPRLSARSGQAPCAAARPPRIVRAAAGFRRAEFAFVCASSKDIALRDDAFFDLVPTHVNLAQIQTLDGGFVQQILTADAREIAMENAGGDRLKNARFSQFVGMGVMHIFTGIDHMAFLVGLVLISRRLRDLTFVVTGFTLGHSLTLALAVTGVIRPHAEFIDALVALTIALVGAENIAVATRRPGLVALTIGGLLALMAILRLMGVGLLPPLLLFGSALFAANYLLVSGHLRDAGRLRLAVSLIFGLIHGFGFAADLLESPIPAARLAELLVGFNLGVEIGQLTLVLALSGTVYALGRRRWILPRPIVIDVAASTLIGIGVYWFVGRSF